MVEIASNKPINHSFIVNSTVDRAMFPKENEIQHPEDLSFNPSIRNSFSTSLSTTSSYAQDSLSSIFNSGASNNSSLNISALSSLGSNSNGVNTNSLLSHSHLKPGRDASLLSHIQTINMYRESAKKTNNPDIQYDLAIFMIETAKHISGDRNTKEEYFLGAEKLLKQLSLKGHKNAQYELGKSLASGLLGKKSKTDLDKAFSLFVQASKRGHTDASNRTAKCYEEGLGCRVNGAMAIQFHKKAASLGHPGSMFRLGVAYINGELGLKKDAKESVKWYTRSCEAATPEYPEALYEFGLLHLNGIPNIIFVDLSYAVSLFAQAADMGYGPAAFKLGECYEHGRLNCQPDVALSLHYYTIAAERGSGDACFALATWYLVGSPNILPQSDDQAYIWARRAAESELPKAEYAVGYFTEVGIGCNKNDVEAIQWYNKAAKSGDKRAIQRLQAKNTPKSMPPGKKKKRSPQDDCSIM